MKITTLAFCMMFTLLVSCNNEAPTKSIETESKEVAQKPKDKVITTKDQRPMNQRGGEFTLFGKDGAVSLADFKGKVVAIYFGYTQCPDVCPTNLALLGNALKQLSEDELKRFQGIFISVDPGRDSPESLVQYTHYFHPKIIGLSGAPADLDPVVAQYGAYYEKISYSNSALLYGISHTSETYIVSTDGQLSTIMPHAAPAEDITKAIRAAMK